MWPVLGKPKDPSVFGQFDPSEVLIWYDGPRTFTFTDQDGGLCLAHWLDDVDGLVRYAVAPVSEQHISRMKTGELTLRECLDQPRVYVVDVTHSGDAISVWSLNRLTDIPDTVLPAPGTMVRRELEPFFCLRATGRTIRPGEIPGSVIRTTVEGAQKAIKGLAEYEMGVTQRQGQPSRALKELYDLPAQKLLAASFEVQFRSPLTDEGLFKDLPADVIAEERSVLDRVGQHLRTGLNWLKNTQSDYETLPDPQNEELSRVIIEAVKHLTPPTRGAIESMEVRGEAVGLVAPARLTRDSRRKIIEVEKRQKASWIDSAPFNLKGTIINILGDEAQITVEYYSPGIPPPRHSLCQLTDEQWDSLGESLHFNQQVEIWAVRTGSSSPLQVISIR